MIEQQVGGDAEGLTLRDKLTVVADTVGTAEFGGWFAHGQRERYTTRRLMVCPSLALIWCFPTEEAGIKPFCFVLMPFGEKTNPSGGVIDFDAVYDELIRPAIESADMEAIRSDEERVCGIIDKQTFERLILCEYAIADVTTANPSVFYQLGVRHAIRPQSTVVVFAGDSRLPFDVAPLLSVSYSTTGGRPDAASDDAAVIGAALGSRTDVRGSPIYELVDDLQPLDISRLKTDVFRDRVDYAAQMKARLAVARSEGAQAVASIQAELTSIEDTEFAVLIDLFLSHRAVRAWNEMIELAAAMPGPLARSVMVKEQLALALNRVGRSEEAEQILLELIEERGPSSETYGILGRIYKDRWDAAEDDHAGRRYLDKAIDAYTRGFESDWRDAYPGVNAVTLMELAEPPDPRRHDLIPVVRYSSQRRLDTGQPDYWDHATLLELAVLACDVESACHHAGAAAAEVREVWEPETTIRNLNLIREARIKRDEPVDWLASIIGALEKAMADLSG